MKKTIVALFVVVCLQSAFANTPIAPTSGQPTITTCTVAAAPSNIIFLDPETKTAYVDVKALDGAASQILVKDNAGKTILDKDIAAERTDAVIEIDMSKYEKGAYMIEVSTYSQTIKQEVIID